MATVDLGKIKFHWRGAFSNSNTYEADDVVSHAVLLGFMLTQLAKREQMRGASKQ